MAATLALLATTAHAAGSLPQMGKYASRLHHVRHLLDRMSKEKHFNRFDLNTLDAELRSLNHVRLIGGRTLSTDSPAIAARLLSGDRAVVQATARELDAIDNDLHTIKMSPGSTKSMQKLDVVLQDGRFAGTPIDRLRRWLTDQFVALAARVLTAVALSPGISILLAAAFLLMVAGTALVMGQRAKETVRADRLPRMQPEDPVTSIAAYEQAGAAAAGGEFRLALRALFLATLLELQEKRALSLSPGMTNREYAERMRSQVSRYPRATGPLLELINAFESAWYGHVPVTAAEFSHLRAVSRDLLTGIDQERAA